MASIRSDLRLLALPGVPGHHQHSTHSRTATRPAFAPAARLKTAMTANNDFFSIVPPMDVSVTMSIIISPLFAVEVFRNSAAATQVFTTVNRNDSSGNPALPIYRKKGEPIRAALSQSISQQQGIGGFASSTIFSRASSSSPATWARAASFGREERMYSLYIDTEDGDEAEPLIHSFGMLRRFIFPEDSSSVRTGLASARCCLSPLMIRGTENDRDMTPPASQGMLPSFMDPRRL